MTTKTHSPTVLPAFLALCACLFAAQSLHAANDVPSPRKVEVPGPLACEQIESILAEPADYVIIDARSPSEFDDGHVETAINIPYDSVPGYAELLPTDKDQLIVTYCRSGGRATVLKGLLSDMGYTRISVVPGIQMDRSHTPQLGFKCVDN
jgi:rhodanese-related sulfurtransferase